MNAEQIRSSFEWWMSDEGRFPRAIERKGDGYLLAQSQTCWDAWEASARLAVDPALQSLISERDAALARVSELEALIHYPDCWDTAIYPTFNDALREIGCSEHGNAPNVRDAGPTPYSGRTTRREG